MKLVKVRPPKMGPYPSDNCPDHWVNVILYGKCEMHGKKPEVKKLEEDVMPF